MSEGYKERVLVTDNAIAMWSFDGDLFDRLSHLPINSTLIDEVGNVNPARIVHDTPTIPTMTLGHPSLVDLEPSGQYCAIFTAEDGPYAIPQFWPKTFLTVDHSSAFSFPEYGSFSVEFLVRKFNENHYGAWTGSAYWTKITPIIRKSGAFAITTSHGYSGNYTKFEGPLATHYVQFSTLNIENGPVHFVMTWDVKRIDTFEYLATQTVYGNNRLLGRSTQTYFGATYPNTNATTPIEIAGQSDFVAAHGDRCTGRMYLDQIAIYGYALTHDQVSSHYKKIFTYRSMIINEAPQYFWELADLETSADNQVDGTIGGRSGYLYGGAVRNTLGPPSLPPIGAVSFSSTGWLSIPSFAIGGGMTPFKNITGDYTFEFWYKSSSSNICTLLSMCGYNALFDGWLLELNVAGNSYMPGAIQFTERRGVSCHCLGTFADGEWRHLAVRRKGTKIDVLIDATPVATVSAGTSILAVPGQLMLFGGDSRSFAGPGAISNIVIYEYALEDAQIKARSTYNVGYEIKGIVTLQGNPIAATLRFYYSNTGEFVKEIDSDPETGEYRIELYSNRSVDIMVFDKYNKNVRYRAFGPVAPAGFEDFPVSP